MTPSQYASYLRQLAQKQKSAINNYNSAVRKHNAQVKRNVDAYNRGVREYNSKLRAYRQRINSELAKLRSMSSTPRNAIVTRSAVSLHTVYERLEHSAADDGSYRDHLIALAERENANSLEVVNAINRTDADTSTPILSLQDTRIEHELRSISQDLDMRWRGAVYALSPKNPDAARHFCTSAREILAQILESSAPDHVVFASDVQVDTTEQGAVTRRSKVRFLLQRKGLDTDALEDFVVEDIDNLVSLFRVLNDGTHGAAGAHDFSTLASIKKRVEDGILFLTEVVSE